MQQRSIGRFLLLFAPAILLSGCFRVVAYQKLYPNLQIDQKVSFEVTEEMQAMMEEMGGSGSDVSGEGMDLEEMCAGAREEALTGEGEIRWLWFRCRTVSSTKVMMDGRGIPKDRTQVSKKTLTDGSVQYRFVLQADDLVQQSSMTEDSEGSDAAMEEFSTGLASAIFDMKLTLVMPGKITNAGGGTLVAPDTVEFTTEQMAESDDGQEIVIESIDSSPQRGMSRALRPLQKTVTPAVPPAVLDEQQERICARLERFADNPSVLARVQARIEGRFGFRCFEM